MNTIIGQGSDSAKNIATAASLFMVINSMSGLAGQFTKASTRNGIFVIIGPYFP
ncbi:hypothetical protein ABXT43_02090 [Candidatus Pelagibacter sp. Uisw_114]